MSGKVDRKALPPPGSSRPELPTPLAEPLDGEERELADLWCEILGLDEVGRDDDFFLLGGDSLSALELSYRAERILGRDLTPAIFSSLTIARMAAPPRDDPPVEGGAEPASRSEAPSLPDSPARQGHFAQRLRESRCADAFSAARSLGAALLLYVVASKARLAFGARRA